MRQTLPASTRASLHTPDPHLMHQTLPASSNPMSHGSDLHHMHQPIPAHPKPSLHAPNPHLMHQTLPSSASPTSARAASQSVSGTMERCRSWGCSAIDILLFNGFMLHLQRDTGTPKQVDELGALFSPPHKVSAVAVTQNPLLGACFAYKIPVFPPPLGNRHAVLRPTVCQKMQILVSRGPRVGVRGAVSGCAPIWKRRSGLRQEMWCVVKVGHSSGVETRANPPAPPSFPALAQGGWMVVRGDLVPPCRGTEGRRSCCTGSWVCLPGFCLCISKEWGCSFCLAQLSSAPARAPLQDGLCSGMSPPSHPADIPGLG